MHLFLQLAVIQNVPVHIHPVPHRRFQYRDIFNEMCKPYPSGVLYAELWQKGCFQSVDAISVEFSRENYVLSKHLRL